MVHVDSISLHCTLPATSRKRKAVGVSKKQATKKKAKITSKEEGWKPHTPIFPNMRRSASAAVEESRVTHSSTPTTTVDGVQTVENDQRADTKNVAMMPIAEGRVLSYASQQFATTDLDFDYAKGNEDPYFNTLMTVMNTISLRYGIYLIIFHPLSIMNM